MRCHLDNSNNKYCKTTYQGNLNCFFLCFVSLHSLRIFYTSFSSLDHIDGSASQTHVFISLSKLLPAPHHNNNKNRALLCCHFSHGKNLLNWDLRLSCRVLWQCKTTKNALSVYRVSETLLK